MKPSNEIINFLIKNAVADKFLLVEKTRMAGIKVRPLHDLLLRLSGPQRYTVPLEKFESFIDDKYSFEKYMRQIHEEGTLRFNGVPEMGSFYDQEKYRKAFDNINGVVADYEIVGRPRYIAFYLRSSPEDFLYEFSAIKENALELGLLIG